jgi:hypothetical protein
VTAPLLLQPDGAYLLPGGEAPLRLLEVLGTRADQHLGELPLSGEAAEHSVDSREPEVARVDMARGVVVAGGEEDETSLLVRDLEGNIVKGVPVRVVNAHRMEVVAHPYPESRQLIINHEYDINITIFDKDNHEIFPSENILTKTTFGKQFDIVDISMNGLWARVKAVGMGVGKIKASLRSTLTPEDEETELVPHVKGVAEFQIFEEVGQHNWLHVPARLCTAGAHLPPADGAALGHQHPARVQPLLQGDRVVRRVYVGAGERRRQGVRLLRGPGGPRHRGLRGQGAALPSPLLRPGY